MEKKNNLDFVKIRDFTAEQLKQLPHVQARIKLEESKNSKGVTVRTSYVMYVKLFEGTVSLRFFLKEPAFFIIKKLWGRKTDDFIIQIPYRLVIGENEDLREGHKGEWNKYCFFETLPCGVKYPELYLNQMLTNMTITQLDLYGYLKDSSIVDRGRKSNPIETMDDDVIESKS